MEKRLLWIASVGFTLFFLLGIIAIVKRSGFFADSLIGMAGLLLLYRYRHKVLLSAEGAALIMIAAVMNNAGVLGFYDIYLGPVGWDKLIHLTAMAGTTLLCYAFLRKRRLNITTALIITFFVVQGFGAINEVSEFLGSYYLGIGQGLFGMQNGSVQIGTFDAFDTQWDMVFNTFAILIGITYTQLMRFVSMASVRSAKVKSAAAKRSNV
jgi:hypothetical protein